jgi:hypothetical protein
MPPIVQEKAYKRNVLALRVFIILDILQNMVYYSFSNPSAKENQMRKLSKGQFFTTLAKIGNASRGSGTLVMDRLKQALERDGVVVDSLSSEDPITNAVMVSMALPPFEATAATIVACFECAWEQYDSLFEAKAA